MDIDLFADMVRNLILDNDQVTLPGLGTFVSEVMPSTFSDKGYTINPPYRRLSFRQRWDDADSLLVDFYSEANGTDKELSRKILSRFLSGLNETLRSKKVVILPGLGRLRATKENNFFFIADEDLDIYPYGVGLEPLSLKTHEETDEEVSAAVVELRQIVEAPAAPAPTEAAAPAPTEAPAETPTADPHTETPAETPAETPTELPAEEKTPTGKGPVNWAFVIPFCIVVAVILFFAVFFLASRFAPDLLDKLLYTREELQIINYPL